MNTPLDRILKHLAAAERILLLTHRDPDPDAVGATQAMAALLESQGKSAEVLYVLQQRKTNVRPGPRIRLYRTESGTPKPVVDLSAYDYALCLDTSFSERNILGFEPAGSPRLGVGIIDHHSRSDAVHYPSQDYTLEGRSSTCEILFEIIQQHFAPLENMPAPRRRFIARHLLAGMLDDMVGLTILEKLDRNNLAILARLKSILGPATFKRMLMTSRTLKLPNHVKTYSRYLRHFLLKDAAAKAYHGYLLSIPPEEAAYFNRVYTQSLLLFEYYARTICERDGNHYGIFLLTIEESAPGIAKVSARGPLVRPIMTALAAAGKPAFVSYGISGDSAFGGKVRTAGARGDLGASLIREAKKAAAKRTLKSKYEHPRYKKLAIALEELLR